MKSSEIRQKFLEFFESKGHKVLPSASLIPKDDPTLLWINAGMAPFKAYFDGSATPPKRRVSNSQKCIRTNDIENVGKTARHHTFFEMLGNFSFGDYFKEDTIKWAYEFLVKELELDRDKLWISIYEEDDEAFDIWYNQVGVDKEKIVRMGKDENFWEIGTGPCGPCSEIHYDRGVDYGCGDDCKLGCDCDRYLEIWNLVFTQYNKTEDGEYLDLPNKNIDTGSGLERLVSLLQDAPTNFETDLFMPMINFITNNCDANYGDSDEADMAIKVIADHIRGVSFAISDGALPSNEGRGYVVRRILRRAVRYAKVLGLETPFLHKLVPVVVDVMGGYYGSLKDKEGQIKKIVRQEELRFQETLEQGMNILEDIIAELKEKGLAEIPGDKVFALYDTYGFPKELTEEIALERGFEIDSKGFVQSMDEQRKRARAAREDYDKDHSEVELFKEIRKEVGNVEFIGYQERKAEAKVVSLVKEGEKVEVIKSGEKGKVVLDKTPFYAEGGGQIGDKGVLSKGNLKVRILDTKEVAEVIVHQVEVLEGELVEGLEVEAIIDEVLRRDITRNHTATHLLHKVLKDLLGDHINQAGSLVTSERLRFDFSHFEALSKKELEKIEDKVNSKVLENLVLSIKEMTLDEAKALGATALFGEKYGEGVRVVAAGDYSIELCGGTHVQRTGEIGLFKIVNESGIAAGTRRIEGVTGRGALDYIKEQEGIIDELGNSLRANPKELKGKVEGLQGKIKDLEKEINRLKDKLASSQSGDLLSEAKDLNGVQAIIHSVDSLDADGLRKMGDNLKERLDSGIIVLASILKEKVIFVAIVSDDLVKEGYHAGKIIGQVAKVAGGGGGGRPNMAQAGGTKVDKVEDALRKAEELISFN
ncbi:alanine--tRNA ligase [Halonatronum saccharophilum]|uniref:alanine--tRNA ligase n=1 Tax=Halonatronum saccharophilum TaxID=150060 RepID=UPI0004832D50|nr:alanine--tRNA ligase [Halonatronum saccharophilum]